MSQNNSKEVLVDIMTEHETLFPKELHCHQIQEQSMRFRPDFNHLLFVIDPDLLELKLTEMAPKKKTLPQGKASHNTS